LQTIEAKAMIQHMAFFVVTLLMIPTAAFPQSILECGSELSGANVVPPTNSSGRGGFHGQWPGGVAPYDSLELFLFYDDLEGNPRGARLSKGEAGTGGESVDTLTAGYFASGTRFTVHVPDVGPLLDDLEASSLYVTIDTEVYPEGEIGGQIVCGWTATRRMTWGRIRAMYR
jgi:hypothetical protein